MADRTDYFFRMKVSEAELDLGFELLEKADRNLAADVGIYGIISGAEPTPHAPVPDLTIDLTAPGRAYDNLGQRIFFRRSNGQVQILAPAIDTSRRQAFIFAQGDAVEIVSGIWNILQPAVNTVQAALDEIDAELNDHFTGAARRHPAAHIDYPPHGFVAASTVKGALDEIVDDLSSAVAGNPGAQRVGADAVAGAPNALPAGNVDGQLSQLLAWLNAHQSAAAGAHNASAIAAAAHNYISGTSVQAQLQEIADDLQSVAAGLGAAQIGDDAIAGAPLSLVATTVRAQLAALLGYLNTHVGSADHDGRYFTEAESDARYYNVGETVGNADTVDGQHASAFATAGHDHDTRYLRRVYSTQVLMDPGTSQVITTQASQPDLVSVSYNYPDADTGLPQATTCGRGQLTADLRYWITKIDLGGGDKDYRITVSNDSASQLWVNVVVRREPIERRGVSRAAVHRLLPPSALDRTSCRRMLADPGDELAEHVGRARWVDLHRLSENAAVDAEDAQAGGDVCLHGIPYAASCERNDRGAAGLYMRGDDERKLLGAVSRHQEERGLAVCPLGTPEPQAC